jgi:hypothetical protein
MTTITYSSRHGITGGACIRHITVPEDKVAITLDRIKVGAHTKIISIGAERVYQQARPAMRNPRS